MLILSRIDVNIRVDVSVRQYVLRRTACERERESILRNAIVTSVTLVWAREPSGQICIAPAGPKPSLRLALKRTCGHATYRTDL